MKFAVEDILHHLNELKKFNEQNLKDIELTENGEVIKIHPKILEEWRFIGLSNDYFVENEYWKKENWPEIDNPEN